MNIPNDPAILLSYINTKLRDEYSNLDDLCGSLCISREELEKKLMTIGYVYSEETNSFKWYREYQKCEGKKWIRFSRKPQLFFQQL